MDLINWFPGHMTKAMRDIKDKQGIVDCFIVLLDARAPLSSYNEEFDKIAPNKPRFFVLSKMDYTNIDKLNKIINKFKNDLDDYVIVNLKQQSAKQKILKKLNQILESKRKKDMEKGLLKPRLRCFVIGMPNVGKSTLINLLAGNKKVKVANFAGTTRSNQWISAGDIQLLDTPGILMPKLDNQSNALKLVACNLIKQEVISNNDFYYKMLDLINIHCPEKMSEIGMEYFNDDAKKYDELVKFARANNFIKKNNSLDLDRALLNIRSIILNFKNVFWD